MTSKILRVIRIAEIKLSNLIAPSFYSVHNDIKAGAHTFYKLAGGRGSTKSSFIGIEIPLGIMQDANEGKMTHALVMRRYSINLKDSVYEQILWAIDKLGVSHLWKPTLSPLRLTYIPTGQQIIFRGADDPQKIKSIKVAKGYIRYLWFEELDEFEGPEKIRSIQQSVLRGGDKFVVFYSFNPPKSQKAWVNDPTAFSEPNMLEHHSTYLTVPREWLGEEFIIEAEHLKQVKPEAYEHEYMGIATGTGGEVFTNVKIRAITDDEIKQMPRYRYGIDWGFATDPFVWITCGYDRKKRRLIIFDEIYKVGMSNRKAAEEIKKHGGQGKDIVCDSAEPKSIAEIRSYGLRVRGARKGPDSVDYGIHWLQGLDEIVIDDKRCPNAAREFHDYELERDANGNLKAEYPDKNNHCLTGDTVVNTPDGDFPISQLVGKQGRVYCYDNGPAVSRYNNVRMTQKNAPVFEIELQDGRTVKATAEHPILTQNGWKCVQDLTDNDMIVDIGGSFNA